jgi:hypothetical protein
LEVHAAVASASATYRVGRMLCDPPKWFTEVEGWQAKYGKDTANEPIVRQLDTNQARKFAPAVDRWLTGIAEGTHTHDGEALATEHVKAAHKQKVHLAEVEGDRTMYVLVKGSDKRRIDGAVADVLAYEAAMTMPATSQPAANFQWA